MHGREASRRSGHHEPPVTGRDEGERDPMMKSTSWTRLAAVAVLGSSLAGCAAMGTTVDEDDPETEVPNVSMGRSIMESLGAVPSRRTPINYSPRAPLVVPPSTEALAPPEDPNRVASLADWPVDPEIATARRLRAAEKRDAERGDDALLSPSELLATRVPPTDTSLRRAGDSGYDPARPLMPSQLKGMPMTAQAQGPYEPTTGTPRRRALVEPPVEYLTPAPGQPVALPDPDADPKKKKGLFSWFGW